MKKVERSNFYLGCSSKVIYETQSSSPGKSLTFQQLPPTMLDEDQSVFSEHQLVSKKTVHNVSLDYKIIGFFNDENTVLLILSSQFRTEIRLIKSYSQQAKQPPTYPKRTVLADFDPVSKILLLYWIENGNHSLSTFLIDSSSNNFIKPLRTFPLAQSGRYDHAVLSSPDPLLLKLALFADGTKAVALDRTNHFVFIDLKFDKMNHRVVPLKQNINHDTLWIRTVKSNLLIMIYKSMGKWFLSCRFLSTNGRSDISLMQPLKEEIPLEISHKHPSIQLHESKEHCKLLILEGQTLSCVDLLISLQSSSLYLHHEDDRQEQEQMTNSSNDVLEVVHKSIRKFSLRKCHDSLSSVVDAHTFTVVAPVNQSTISKLLSTNFAKLQTEGFLTHPIKVEVTSEFKLPENSPSIDGRSFVQRWIESIPIQVARIDGGVFLPLQDGHDSSEWLQMEQVHGITAQQIAKQLRFGVLELIFSGFPSYPISVVVCAGSQSSGKSSFLNHLFNHFFDVAGSRTTQGVWFGVRVFEERIWLAIDLEGLGSFERTAQEDCYQSLFGAALAQCFILRTTHHFDRFIQNCLNSWSEAAVVLATGDDLFKGTLIMAPRDVSDEAAGEVIEDFTVHLQPIWDESLRIQEGHQRHALSIFPTTRVIPWPSYAAFPDYSEEIGLLVDDLINEEPRFTSPSSFHQTATLLLAKLYVQDFTSLSETALKQLIDEVESSLPDLIAVGMIGPIEGQQLQYLPDDALEQWLSEAVVDDHFSNTHSLPLSLPLTSDQQQRLLSSQCILGQHNNLSIQEFPDVGLFIAAPTSLQSAKKQGDQIIFEKLASFFTTNILVQRHRGDKSLFESFLQSILTRRRLSIIQWFKSITVDHQKESVFTRMGNDVQTKLDGLVERYMLCRGICRHLGKNQSNACNLECSLLVNHEGDCSCLGDHACEKSCSICPQKQCSLGAGHDSNCLCSAGHVYGQECSLNHHLGCASSCIRQKNHEGDCLCGTPYEAHLCGHECSLPGCNDKCQEPHHVEHSRHHCGSGGCPHKCPLCQRMCCSTDHFHEQESDQHLCGNDHNCPHECSKRGNCEVLTHLRQREETYVTSTGDQITYQLFSEQNAVRRQCGVSISRKCTSHQGSCDCIADSHFCDVKCDSCGYFCMLPIDHEGPHSATHGNMGNLRLVSSSQEVRVGSVGTFGRGDSGICLTCTNSCREFGRGHIHLVPSDHPKLDHIPDTSKKPQSTTYEKGFEFFEVTCEAYWEYVLEFDPNFQSAELELFKKCPAVCSADHEDKVFCELEIFHEPYQGELPSTVPNGYISRDGHVFSCTHYVGGNFHTFLIFDRSGSMSDSSAQPTLSWITQKNKLGAVIEAIYHYISRRVQQNPNDLFSFVTFNSSASVLQSSVQLPANPQSNISSIMSGISPSGGTSFYRGFEVAINKCKQIITSRHKPIFIFLSDGWDGNEHERTRQLIRSQFKSFPETVIHTIGFGDGAGHSWLQEIASLGNGNYHRTTDTISLCDTFVGISAQPDRSAFV
ncbi:hypothetical protein P9112_013856 [Eukaryota sp. TZLM1-RC]